MDGSTTTDEAEDVTAAGATARSASARRRVRPESLDATLARLREADRALEALGDDPWVSFTDGGSEAAGDRAALAATRALVRHARLARALELGGAARAADEGRGTP